MVYTIEVEHDGSVLLTSPKYAEYLTRYGGTGRAEQLIERNEWVQLSDWEYGQRLDGSWFAMCTVQTPYEFTFESESWDLATNL